MAERRRAAGRRSPRRSRPPAPAARRRGSAIKASASAGRSALAAQRREQRAPVLALGQPQQPPAREAARVEDVARAVERGPRCGTGRRPAPAAIWSASARPTRPKPSSTTSVRGAAGGRPPPIFDELEGGVDAARRLGGRRAASTTNEMLSSEEPWAMAITLTPPRGERREDAGGDARRARHAVAHDRDHRHARRAPSRRRRARPRARRERPSAARRPRAPASASGSVKPIELSDEAWKMVETETPSAWTAAKVRAAMPGTPIMPFPATVTSAWPRIVASAFTG